MLDANGKRLGLITGQPEPDPGRLRARSARRCATRSIAIEDKRFYENRGIDIRGIGRALYQDVAQQAAPSRAARRSPSSSSRTRSRPSSKRTIFQKLREAALAYHLTRKWTQAEDPHRVPELDLLRQRRLRHRVRRAHLLRRRSAARRRAGRRQPVLRRAPRRRHRRRCSRASSPRRRPTTRSSNPAAAKTRRDLVLRNMLEQGYITQRGLRRSRVASRSRPRATSSPRARTRGALLHDLGEAADRRPLRRPSALRRRPEDQDDARPRPPEGGRAGRRRPDARGRRPDRGPRGDRQPDRRRARDGRRHRRLQRAARSTSPPRASASPGSAFKPFVLAAGAAEGHRAPTRPWESKQKFFDVPNSAGKRDVRRQQLRGRLLRHHQPARARPPQSDNSVYAEVGLKVGHAQDRPARAQDGDPHAGLDEPGDDARRPQAGRHAARHGPRLPDARAPAACGSGARSGAGKKGPVGIIEVRRPAAARSIARTTRRRTARCPSRWPTTETADARRA